MRSCQKSLRSIFSPNFAKIGSGLRPLPIFSKFGLISMDNDKFWRLVFLGRLTGSGSAPQEADMGCRALVNGSDSCISAVIGWFLG